MRISRGCCPFCYAIGNCENRPYRLRCLDMGKPMIGEQTDINIGAASGGLSGQNESDFF